MCEIFPELLSFLYYSKDNIAVDQQEEIEECCPETCNNLLIANESFEKNNAKSRNPEATWAIRISPRSRDAIFSKFLQVRLCVCVCTHAKQNYFLCNRSLFRLVRLSKHSH